MGVATVKLGINMHQGLTEEAARQLATSVTVVAAMSAKNTSLKEEIDASRNRIADLKAAISKSRTSKQKHQLDCDRLFQALGELHRATSQTTETVRLLREVCRQSFDGAGAAAERADELGDAVFEEVRRLTNAKKQLEVAELGAISQRERERQLRHEAAVAAQLRSELLHRIKRLEVASEQCELTSDKIAGSLLGAPLMIAAPHAAAELSQL